MPLKTVQSKSPIFKNLTGGLNVREAVSDIGDNEGIQVSNLTYYTAGALVRRGGWKKLFANSPTTNKLMGGFQAAFNNAGIFTYFLVITDGIDMWQTVSPTTPGATVVWTKITGGFSFDNTQPYKFLQMANKMVFYNGKVVGFWTGVGNVTAMPGGGNTLTIQDLTYTAVGTNQSATTIAYITGGTAGSEVVTIVGQSITIQIQSGTSTANQIRTAFNASASATALASVAVTGIGGNAQSAPVSATFVQNIAAPLSLFGIVWQNYVFWFGDGTNPNRLYFSNLGDPTTYPAANFIDVPSPFDGDPLKGGAILYGNLITFKRFSLYVLQGTPPNNLILSKLNASIGCVEPASIIQADNLVYFISDKGLYAANLFNVRQVSYKVEPRYTIAVPASTQTSPIWAAHYKPRGQIFMSINYGKFYGSLFSGNDRIICHDYFNSDQNQDPAASEFIVGYTNFGLQTAKINNPGAPFWMADYFYSGGSISPVTVMSSFYDQFVYVMVEGGLGGGGPADEVQWLLTASGGQAQFPPTDFLSKFYDFGDPDMIKTVRWVWTTGQLYNGINLQAGIVFNNSPTAVSFIDFNSNVVALKDSNGVFWALGVDDDGALTTNTGGNPVFLETPILTDSNNQNWIIGVDTDGALTTNKTNLPATGQFVLASANSFQYIVGVDTDGALTTNEVFAPGLTTIIPGERSIVNPIVGQASTSRYGKYVQIYFVGIGILVQFSFDWINKGRRN